MGGSCEKDKVDNTNPLPRSDANGKINIIIKCHARYFLTHASFDFDESAGR